MLILRNLLLASLLTVFTLNPLYAKVDKGHQAAQKDDYKTAFKFWKKLAEKGDAERQATIAVLYHAGQGVKQNYKKAFYWYKKAAEQGHTAAQANLGVMYAKGTGTQQDYVQSYAWYSVAAKAEQGRKVGNELWGLEKVKSLLSKQQLSKAESLSKKYLKKYMTKSAKN